MFLRFNEVENIIMKNKTRIFENTIIFEKFARVNFIRVLSYVQGAKVNITKSQITHSQKKEGENEPQTYTILFSDADVISYRGTSQHQIKLGASLPFCT